MRISRTLITVLAIAAAGETAQAQAQLDSTAQTVNMSVSTINKISFAASVSLNIASGTAGTALTTTASSTYDIISNDSLVKITAALDSDMPTGSALSVNLTAPTSATSAGRRTLSTTPVELVTGIHPISETAIPLTYTFDADVNTPATLTRVVSYVLIQGA
jgi:hypothetical protein